MQSSQENELLRQQTEAATQSASRFNSAEEAAFALVGLLTLTERQDLSESIERGEVNNESYHVVGLHQEHN